MAVDDRTRQCIGAAGVSGLVTLVSCFLPWVVLHPEKMKGLAAFAFAGSDPVRLSGWSSSVGPAPAAVGNWMVAAYCLSAALILWLQAIGSFPRSRLIPVLLLALGAAHIVYLVATVHGDMTPAVSGPVVAAVGLAGLVAATVLLPRSRQRQPVVQSRTEVPAP